MQNSTYPEFDTGGATVVYEDSLGHCTGENGQVGTIAAEFEVGPCGTLPTPPANIELVAACAFLVGAVVVVSGLDGDSRWWKRIIIIVIVAWILQGATFRICPGTVSKVEDVHPN